MQAGQNLEVGSDRRLMRRKVKTPGYLEVDLPCARRSGQVRLRREEWPDNLRESHRGLAGVDDISSDSGDLEESEDARRPGHGMGLDSALDWSGFPHVSLPRADS